nr:SDR family oxidoreductase [Microbacterium pseudoresistens]
MADHTVLITGASSGIGRASARLAAERGARIGLVARNEAALRATRDDLPGTGHVVLPADLSDDSTIPDLVRRAVDELGALSGFVHAAGAHAFTPLRTLSARKIAELYQLNVAAALLILKELRRPEARAEELSAVFVSSAVGIVGSPGVSGYAASKAAVAAAARSLALEVADEKIRVNSVAAGVVSTPLTDKMRQLVGPDGWSRIESAHPLGLGSPDDIASAIIFLLSADARWITGSTMAVDGGYTAQ